MRTEVSTVFRPEKGGQGKTGRPKKGKKTSVKERIYQSTQEKKKAESYKKIYHLAERGEKSRQKEKRGGEKKPRDAATNGQCRRGVGM